VTEVHTVTGLVAPEPYPEVDREIVGKIFPKVSEHAGSG
jgi:hypothetical protein